MWTYARSIACLVVLSAAIPLRVAGAQSTSGARKTACALMPAAEIRKLTGRSDLATAPPEPEETTGHSNCIYSGAFDIGVTVEETLKINFTRMRDTYAKAPSRLGYRVEVVSGVGDDAYYLMDKDRVMLKALVGQTEATIALTKISMLPGTMPPEPEAKKLALTLAKALVAKLR